MSKIYNVGMDVHKKTLVIAMVSETGKLVLDEKIDAKPEALLAWLKRNRRRGTLKVGLEASGSSPWVTYLLLEQKIEVTPAHPNHIRAIAETKRKSDRLDARKLAELLRLGVLQPVNIPTQQERATRELLRQMRRLVETRTRAKNAVTSLLCTLGLASPYSDTFGKGGRRWIANLELRVEHRIVVEQQLAQVDLLGKQLKELDEALATALRASPLYELVRTIPGVGPRIGAAIALEFGDVRRFKTAKAAACYTGLIPSTYQSGEKARGGKITKEGNPTLRWALVQAVMHLVKGDEGAKKRYVRLRNRIKRSKARVAMARHLAISIWHMARTGEAYRCAAPSSVAKGRPSKRKRVPESAATP